MLQQLGFETSSIPSESSLNKFCRVKGDYFFAKLPRSIKDIEIDNYPSHMYAYKYDGTSATFAYTDGVLYIILRDGTVFSRKHQMLNNDVIGSLEIMDDELIITDIFIKAGASAGAFKHRVSLIMAVARSFNKFTTKVRAQEYYGYDGFFKKYPNECDLEEGIIVMSINGLYEDKDPGIYKWKRTQKCTVDLLCIGRKGYTSDMDCKDPKQGIPMHVDFPVSCVYEMTFDGRVVRERKKNPNSMVTVLGVLYNYYCGYQQFRNMMVDGVKPKIATSYDTVKNLLSRVTSCIPNIEKDTTREAFDDDRERIESRYTEYKVPLVSFSTSTPINMQNGTTNVNLTNAIFASSGFNVKYANGGSAAEIKAHQDMVNKFTYTSGQLQRLGDDIIGKIPPADRFIVVKSWTKIKYTKSNGVLNAKIKKKKNSIKQPKEFTNKSCTVNMNQISPTYGLRFDHSTKKWMITKNSVDISCYHQQRDGRLNNWQNVASLDNAFNATPTNNNNNSNNNNSNNTNAHNSQHAANNTNAKPMDRSVAAVLLNNNHEMEFSQSASDKLTQATGITSGDSDGVIENYDSVFPKTTVFTKFVTVDNSNIVDHGASVKQIDDKDVGSHGKNLDESI